MFEAVRSRLVGAWRDLRSRGLFSLFFFELVVVTLGVLLAQAAANWAEARSARERLDGSLARVGYAIARDRVAAEAWQVAVPCYRERLTAIMALAGNGEDVPSAWLRRGGFRSTFGLRLADEDALLLRKTQGDELANRYDRYRSSERSLDTGIDGLTSRWQNLAVLDPSLGAVQAGDRVNARQTAAEMLSALRRIEIVAPQMIEASNELGIQTEYEGERIARDCAEILNVGMIIDEEEGV